MTLTVGNRERGLALSADALFVAADELLLAQAERADAAAEEAMSSYRTALTDLAVQNRELRAALILAGGELRERDRLHVAERSAATARVAALENELREAMRGLEMGHEDRRQILTGSLIQAGCSRTPGIRHRMVRKIMAHEKLPPRRSLSEGRRRVDSLNREWDRIKLTALADESQAGPVRGPTQYHSSAYQPTSAAVEDYLRI